MPGTSFAGADFPIPAVTGSQPAIKLCGRLNSHIDRLLIWKQLFLPKKVFHDDLGCKIGPLVTLLGKNSLPLPPPPAVLVQDNDGSQHVPWQNVNKVQDKPIRSENLFLYYHLGLPKPCNRK